MSENSTRNTDIAVVIASDGKAAGEAIVALALSGAPTPPQIDIDAIEARANAATPEPWRFQNNFGRLEIMATGQTHLDAVAGHYGIRQEDADFIAASRADVPALCREVRRLREQVATVERQRDGVQALREHEIGRRSTDLEHRLLVAWRASGVGLGKLLVLAANEYAIGAAVSMTAICDEAMVSHAERWVREHAQEGT